MDALNSPVLPPSASRSVGLVRLRGKRGSDGVKVVAQALMSLRRVRNGG